MIKELIHDPFFLAMKSEKATGEDIEIANNLLDTLIFHKETCVGMAANMIGERKCIIAFLDESGKKNDYTVMLNPVITKKEHPFEAEESCVSLLGSPRKCKRFKSIKVEYQNMLMQNRVKSYTGFTAQIIQHEIDRCNGILI